MANCLRIVIGKKVHKISALHLFLIYFHGQFDSGKKKQEGDNNVKSNDLNDELPPIFYFTDGCPQDCYNNGNCMITQSGWACKCRDNWKGDACDISMETQCKDHTDNDGGKT